MIPREMVRLPICSNYERHFMGVPADLAGSVPVAIAP
jgi:hypothetical protein